MVMMHNQISESHSDRFLYFLPSFNHLDCLQTLFNIQKKTFASSCAHSVTQRKALHQLKLLHRQLLSYYTRNLICVSLYTYRIFSLNLGYRAFFSVFDQCKWLFHTWIFFPALHSYHLISPGPRLGLSCCIRSLQWVLTRLPLILQGLLKCHNHLEEKATPCWVLLTTNYL